MATENQGLQKSSSNSKISTHSSNQNTAIKHLEPKLAVTEIGNALLRLAKLYQIPNFDETNAMILAEWTIDNFKHKPLALILEALKNPPALFENGEITKNWRLTPDTIYAWIDKKAKDTEALRQEKQSKQELDKVSNAVELSPEVQETIKKCLDDLQKNMFKNNRNIRMSPELERIDLILSLLNQYKKESINPFTGKFYIDAMSEQEWLLDKGYFFENGELKEI